MAKQDDYGPYLSGDIVQATKVRKTSFDQTNSPEYLRAQQATRLDRPTHRARIANQKFCGGFTP